MDGMLATPDPESTASTFDRVLSFLTRRTPKEDSTDMEMASSRTRHGLKHSVSGRVHNHKSTSLQQHSDYLPQVATNKAHFSGELGQANFGYFNINGRWVDPDNNAAVNAAVHGLPDPSLPSEQPSNVTRRAHILSEPDFGAEYGEFMGYVSDDEGDPRENRIAPDQFLQAVSGIALSNTSVSAPFSEHLVVEPSGNVVRPKDKADELPKEHKVVLQFDLETGEELSPDYSTDSFPRPLMSPQGVDMTRIPKNFAQAYPGPYLNLRESVVGEAADPPGNSAYPSDNLFRNKEAAVIPDHHETFTEHGVLEAMSSSSDPTEKYAAFVRMVKRLEEAEKERMMARSVLEGYAAHHEKLLASNGYLRREIGNLKVQHNAVIEATNARHVQQIESRFNEIQQDIAYTEHCTTEIRKNNHKLAEENVNLIEEHKDLTLKLSKMKGDPGMDDGVQEKVVIV